MISTMELILASSTIAARVYYEHIFIAAIHFREFLSPVAGYLSLAPKIMTQPRTTYPLPQPHLLVSFLSCYRLLNLMRIYQTQ